MTLRSLRALSRRGPWEEVESRDLPMATSTPGFAFSADFWLIFAPYLLFGTFGGIFFSRLLEGKSKYS